MKKTPPPPRFRELPYKWKRDVTLHGTIGGPMTPELLAIVAGVFVCFVADV